MIKSVLPNENSKFFKQGYYTPRNPQKYIGDLNNIIYRSQMELDFCRICDFSKKIVKWSSEPETPPFPIRYMHPISEEMKSYYPDYFVVVRQPNNIEERMIIEVKPESLTIPPKRPLPNAKKKTKDNYLNKLKVVAINLAKKRAAEIFCKQYGMRYCFVTEKTIESIKGIF